MNYKIIQDEYKFREFIEWLPELEVGECYYITLFSRKKYFNEPNENIKSDKSQLKRVTATNKEYIYDKVKQMETEIGSYKNNGFPIPQESLALYVSPNPRSMVKATKNALKKFVDLITKDYDGYNPHAIVMSEIQTAGNRRIYMDFDFDGINPQALHLNIDETKINRDCITYIQTRGGCHALVKLEDIKPEFKNSWYKHLSSLEGCDMKGTDSLLNVVGCCQGGFTPKFVNSNFLEELPF